MSEETIEADAPPADSAPNKAAKSPSSSSSSSKSASSKGKSASKSKGKRSLERPLTDLFVSVGALVAPLDQFDSQCIISGAPDLAKSLNQVAQQDPRVYRALERLTSGGAWGGVVVSAMPIILPIAAHHGMLPQALQSTTTEAGATPSGDQASTLGAVLGGSPPSQGGPEGNGAEPTPTADSHES